MRKYHEDDKVYPAVVFGKCYNKTVFFGKYYKFSQNNNLKPIKWLVLEEQEDKALLISRYAIEYLPYHDEEVDNVTWETCSLRKWLNGEFIKTAFNEEEQEKILDTVVSADQNPIFSINQGNDIKDKLFLLSISEVLEYFDPSTSRNFAFFSDREIRGCFPTSYVKGKRIMTNNWGNCPWWLRTIGMDSEYAAGVNSDGAMYSSIRYVGNLLGIRPAMWVKR